MVAIIILKKYLLVNRICGPPPKKLPTYVSLFFFFFKLFGNNEVFRVQGPWCMCCWRATGVWPSEDSAWSSYSWVLVFMQKKIQEPDRCSLMKVIYWKRKYIPERKVRVNSENELPLGSQDQEYLSHPRREFVTSPWHGLFISSPGQYLLCPTFSSSFGSSGTVMSSDAWWE